MQNKISVYVDSSDPDAFYAKVPYEFLKMVHRVGGKWMQSRKEWRFPLDEEIWKKFENVFAEVQIDVADDFKIALHNRKSIMGKFLQAKEIAIKDEPIDFGIDGVRLNGVNPLFNYQRHGIICGLQVGDGFLIGDVMGLGKTIQSIAIAIERKNRGEINSCLVICPASLKYNWLDEINKFTTEKAFVIGHKAKSKEDREKQWIADGYFFKIANYELLARDLYVAPKKADNRISSYKAVLKSFDFVIFDECQYLKHHSSIRTQAARQLQASYRIGLTGTPIDGKLEEIHSIFQVLKPGLFVSKQKFMERYAEFDWFGAVKGYHHVDEVRKKIEPYYLRRLKEVVLKDLPPKMFKDMHVELSDKNMRDYKNLVKGKSKVTDEAQAAEILIRARQFLDFPEIVGMHNSSDKYAVFKELLDELVGMNNEKVIVFSQYTTTIKLLVKNLSDEYKNIQVIDGSVPSQERMEICKRFNNSPEYKILIMSDAGATGLNLQAASAVIHYTDNFSPSIMQQRNDRAHRATTKHTVQIIRFITNDTIEEHVRGILSRKMAVNNALLEESCDEFAIGDMKALELMSCL